MQKSESVAQSAYFVKGKLMPSRSMAVAFAFRIDIGTDGVGQGEMFIPAQGVFGAALTGVTRVDGELRFSFGASKSEWRCRLDDGENSCAVRSQNQPVSCVVEQISEREYSEATRPPRPQTPKPPFPYQVSEFTVDRDAVRLAGTLTLPENVDGLVPAVVLLSGSGAQDRDSTIHWHRPFFVIADYLSRRGVAVLRMDDRGIGQSTGQLKDSSVRDLADDAAAMVTKLGEIEEIDANRVGILGHSLGAGVGAVVASDYDSIAFLILLAGPGLHLQSVMIDQTVSVLAASGASKNQISEKTQWLKSLYRVLENPDAKLRRESAIGLLQQDPAAESGIDDTSARLLAERAIDTPNMRSMVSFNPQEYLKRIRIPVLAVNGSLDIQVDAESNLSAIEAGLKSAKNPDFKTHQVTGVNHLFQPAITGQSQEYLTIEQTVRPDVLELIATWLLARFGNQQ